MVVLCLDVWTVDESAARGMLQPLYRNTGKTNFRMVDSNVVALVCRTMGVTCA